MELWIRSQDKLALTKINTIGIEYDKKLVGYGKICVKLGEYKTKERALEVLDEIQDLIKPKIVLAKMGEILGETCDGTVYSTPNEYDIKELSTILYEMPKE